MASSRRFVYMFCVSLVLWLAAMGSIYYAHYIKHVDEELGYYSSDIVFDSEKRQYFNIYLDGRKIGYKNDARIDQPGMMVFREDGTLKLNLAGSSREVFIQATAGIDSTSLVTRYMEFTIRSGTHVNSFSAIVKQDSLILLVKNSTLAQWRKGVIIVDEHITFPVSLPFFIHNSKTNIMSMQIFDPVEFSLYLIHAERLGGEVLRVGEQIYDTVRYDLRFRKRKATLWLDKNGAVFKSEGYPFFSNIFGSLSIEKAMDRNVFLIPLEVPYGNDLLKQMAFYPQKFIENPRDLSYLEIEFVGMRAANIDISASNKEILSLNPVIFAIHNKPVASGKWLKEELEMAAIDTSIFGMSDYIQTYDKRILRTARKIISADSSFGVLRRTGQDTLAMAHVLNRWVFSNVKKEKSLDIVRSVDILRNMKGDCDEHTKLFTALGRSVGIPTQINMGLVYKDRAFRYHSWPSVFVDGIWHDLDPTFGQDFADATHISLFRGDFDKLVELIRLKNYISLKIHAYR